jgi:hypothetical protein
MRLVCGARTHACSVHTRVNAFSPPPISTRPGIFLGSANQPGLHRIFLNISRNPLPLPIVAHATVVGFPLPERFARPPQDSVRLSRRHALKRLQQQARRRQRPQQDVHMVCHNHKRAKIVLSQVGSFESGSNHQFRNAFLPQEHRADSRMIEISIHPNKRLSAIELSRRRISGVGKTPMQIPTNKEPAVGSVDMRQPSSRIHYLDRVNPFQRISNIGIGSSTLSGISTPTRHLSRGARTHACSVHTFQERSTPALILKHLWGGLATCCRLRVPSGPGPSLWIGRPRRPEFPAQEMLPKGSSFARANTSAPFLRTHAHPPHISRSHECERCTHECVRHRELRT